MSTLLEEAKADHRDHAGYPSNPSTSARLIQEGHIVRIEGDWTTIEHSDAECIEAYRHHAQRMSES